MNLNTKKEGSAADLLTQQVKRAAFRWPGLRELSRPRYNYNLEPAQLAWLCVAIEKTKPASESSAGNKGCIVEVGVARGMTSVFLLQHMRHLRDNRTYFCMDTFAGFVQKDVDYEVKFRHKKKTHFRGFSYNHQEIFERNLVKCGFNNFAIIQSDASAIDWNKLPNIDVMLLDVDLYMPTKSVLDNSVGQWSKDAYVMVDDVGPAGDYDGASQAYTEFCKEKGFLECRVGNKGGVIVMGK
jgi:hypothetical protein